MYVEIDDSEMAMALLNGLPEPYDALISALDALGTEKETLKFDHVKARVMHEEQRIDIRHAESAKKAETAALMMQHRVPNRERPRCTHCKKLGHTEPKCWKKYPHLNPHKKQQEVNAFVASGKDDDPTEICLLANHTKSRKLSDWFIDSGCSNHMTHDKSLFSSFVQVPGSSTDTVQLGNGNQARIAGRGTVNVRIDLNGKTKNCSLMNTLYVPELDYNLLSVPTLDKKNFSTTFEKKRCLIRSERKLFATGSMSGNLYKLDMNDGRNSNKAAFFSKDLRTWHRRLAHIDPRTIQKMCGQGTVTGIDLTRADEAELNCDDCVLGKGHRAPIPKTSASRTSKLLEIVHSDVNGPFEVPSIGGSRYFITFIDDYSRWTEVYMMRNKSEALKCFTKFHKAAEKHTGNRIMEMNTVLPADTPRNSRHYARIMEASTFQMRSKAILLTME